MVSKGNCRNNNHGQSLLGWRFKEVVPPLGPRVSLSRCGCGIEMAERESNSGGDRRIRRGSLTAFMGSMYLARHCCRSFIFLVTLLSLFFPSFQPRPLCYRHNSGQDETIETIMAVHICRNKSRILLRCDFHSDFKTRWLSENGSLQNQRYYDFDVIATRNDFEKSDVNIMYFALSKQFLIS